MHSTKYYLVFMTKKSEFWNIKKREAASVIKSARKALKLSQEEFALRLGITQQHVSWMETRDDLSYGLVSGVLHEIGFRIKLESLEDLREIEVSSLEELHEWDSTEQDIILGNDE